MVAEVMMIGGITATQGRARLFIYLLYDFTRMLSQSSNPIRLKESV